MNQNFFIKRGASLPYLVVKLKPTDYSTDETFNEKLLNADVRFYMKKSDCDSYKIKCKSATVYEELNCNSSCFKDIFIIYQFTTKETKGSGTYEGYFEIDFLDGCGKLVAPINEKLFITILD